MPDAGQLSASVIVPSMAGDRVSELLRSLQAQSAEADAIVIDNASPGGEVSAACREFDFAHAIRLERNLGFSRAVNLAASEATGDALVLVNDDAWYDPNFVERLVATLEPEAGVMAAAGVLRAARDERLIDTAGVEIDRTLLGFDYLHGRPLEILARRPGDPIGPSGAAAAFERGAFIRMGGFDERIFAYLEDVDLALRMRQTGWICRLAADARGTHAGSATLGSGSARKNYLMGFARGYLLRKWGVVNFSRAPGIAAREAVVCFGQAIFDRNTAGVRGRLAGWRTATRGEYPAAVVAAAATPGMAEALARRARRRASARVR